MSHFSGQTKELAKIDRNAIALLVNELSTQAGLWEKWDALKPNRFGVFNGCVQHIVFKYPVDLSDHRLSMTFPIWHDWQPLIQPLIDQAVCSYGYEQGIVARIMLAKLRSKGSIPMHVDSSQSAKIPHKVHIPLQTTRGVVMNFADKNSCHLAVGRAYEVNNRIEHGATNPTGQDRVHLIFDYFSQAIN